MLLALAKAATVVPLAEAILLSVSPALTVIVLAETCAAPAIANAPAAATTDFVIVDFLIFLNS